jgi:hypothetical protein
MKKKKPRALRVALGITGSFTAGTMKGQIDVCNSLRIATTQ